MKLFYSKSTNGFYDSEIHGTKMPQDVVEITQETHHELLEAQSKGKMIVSDDKGYPKTVDRPVSKPTWEQIKSKRDNLLKESDWIDLPNSPSKNKQAWLDYRQALRDVPQKFKKAEDVVWPKAP